MLESLFNKVATQVFSCEHYKIFKNIFFYRTSTVVALVKCRKWTSFTSKLTPICTKDEYEKNFKFRVLNMKIHGRKTSRRDLSLSPVSLDKNIVQFCPLDSSQSFFL